MDEEPDLVIVNSDDPLPGAEADPLQVQDLDENNRNRTRLAQRPRRHPNKAPQRSRRLEPSSRSMKPNVVVDEMFPEGAGPYVDIDEAGGSSGLLMDLAANEKSVHTDFFNQFDDLYDDEDLS
ncbi:hypothetical protein ONE63_004193 [Megalurothrips usitatus]|uniref:COP9 signalosome complex subunit 9 n=1 Tax=Megalurothrips usitatus TaxID=439358 RepID=A0AAV7X7K3_9NEOP|nr:hypothetical protein ONE63_004193 [Megalurothrips usitatus]